MRLALVGVVLLLWYAATTVYTFAGKDERTPADAAIVLGAAAWGDRPSPVFRERINHAIALYEEGWVRYLLFTGGRGVKSPLAEAEVARRYAISRGVPAAAILLEDRSTNTLENLTFARQVAQANGLRSFIIVSTPYHMQRALSMAHDLGLEAYTSPTRTTRWLTPASQTYAFVRETVSYVVYLLAGPPYGTPAPLSQVPPSGGFYVRSFDHAPRFS